MRSTCHGRSARPTAVTAVILGPASTGRCGLSSPGNPTKRGSDFPSLKWALNAKQNLEKELVGTGQ